MDPVHKFYIPVMGTGFTTDTPLKVARYGISSVVLTMAVVEPMVRGAGIDMIWFGIFIVVVVEMAQITPPVGFNLFVMQGMTNHQILYVARCALPFFFLMCVMVALLVAFPELATFLPENMRQTPGG